MFPKNRSVCFIIIIVLLLQIVNSSTQNIFDKNVLTSIESSTLNQYVEGLLETKPVAHKLECSRNIGIFTVYDYSVLLGMLVISLGIGVFYGFFNSSESTSSDFLHGSEMSLLPVSLSLTTSFITAIELLGNPSEIVFNGTQFSLIGA